MSKKIIGNFIKKKTDHRGYVLSSNGDEEKFDATGFVLSMPLNKIRDIEDMDDSSEAIGRHHVEWDGPCAVEIWDSVNQFFGVFDVLDITEEMLSSAKAEYNSVEAKAPVKVLVTMEVVISPAVEDDVDEPISNEGMANLVAQFLTRGNQRIKAVTANEINNLFPYEVEATVSGIKMKVINDQKLI